MNSAIRILYSIPQSIYQYREQLTLNNPNVLYEYNKELYKDDSIYIGLPDISEILILSDIRVEGHGKYDIIVDNRILREVKSILVKKYKKVTIRVYDIQDYEKFSISFDITLAKPSIRSCL